MLLSVVEEVVDVKEADQGIESLAAGGLGCSPPEVAAILAFTISQCLSELIYRYNLNEILTFWSKVFKTCCFQSIKIPFWQRF